MDHKLYQYSALPLQPRFQWPNGAYAAFHVTLFIEHWELAPPPGSVRDQRFISELGPQAPDYRTCTQREYGNRVGIFRVLDVLDRHAIKASVAIGAALSRACRRGDTPRLGSAGARSAEVRWVIADRTAAEGGEVN